MSKKSYHLHYYYEEVSIYIKLFPIGGKVVAPLSLVGLDDLVVLMKLLIFPESFLSRHSINQFCKTYPPVLPFCMIVVSII